MAAEGRLDQRQRNQGDRRRIEEANHRCGDGHDEFQALGGDHHGGDREDHSPEVVGASELLGEVLSGCGDQTHRGGQAGQQHDGGEHGLAGAAHGQVGGLSEQTGTVVELGGVRHDAADQPQADVDQAQHQTGAHTSGDGAVDKLLALAEAAVAQGGNDHDGKRQRGDGIHGEVALEQAGGQRAIVVRLVRRGRFGAPAERGHRDHHDQQHQKRRGEELAQLFHDGGGVPAQRQGNAEKHHVEHAGGGKGFEAEQRGDRRFKGDGTGAR